MKGILTFTRSMGLSAAVALMAVAPQVHATIYTLPPGGAIFAPGSTYPTGGAVVNTITVPFNSLTLDGTLTSSVISGDTSNPYNGLTFTYQLSLGELSPHSASQLTVTSFSGLSTDVSWNLQSAIDGGTVPAFFSRGSEESGQVLRFHFINETVAPGMTSALLVVQTSAMQWTESTAAIMNGFPVTVATLAPFVVPEPGTATLLLLGAVAFAVRRKFSR